MKTVGGRGTARLTQIPYIRCVPPRGGCCLLVAVRRHREAEVDVDLDVLTNAQRNELTMRGIAFGSLSGQTDASSCGD